VFNAKGTQRSLGFYGGWSNTPGQTISYWVELVVDKPVQMVSERVVWTSTCTVVNQ
jgi:hypothetical protein